VQERALLCHKVRAFNAALRAHGACDDVVTIALELTQLCDLVEVDQMFRSRNTQV
jgi:hypothetical protein